MIVHDFLANLGLSPEEESCFWEAYDGLKEQVEEIAASYMRKNLPYDRAIQPFSLDDGEIPSETKYFLFFSACSEYLLEDYRKAGLSEELFWDSMMDFRYKLKECKAIRGKFGIFVPGWYDKFFKMERFALGRLQYDISAYDRESITIADYLVEEGEFMLYCHIPASGPLLPELCLDSLKKAYQMFRPRLKDGILVVKCCSWMLNPNYYPMFRPGSNLARFYESFYIVSSRILENFSHSWLIFDQEYDGDVSKLPANTQLQRNFIQYIKEGKPFGDGSGVLLFDGEKILTQQEGGISSC